MAVDRTRMENLAGGGNRRARATLSVIHRLSFHLSGTQLGITAMSIVLGFTAEPALGDALESPIRGLVGEGSAHGVAVAASLLLATVVQLVVAELIPKNLAVARPERTALAVAPLLRVYGAVFGPLISALNGTANAVVRLLGVEPRDELSVVHSREELASVIRSSAEEGTLDESAGALLSRSIRFGAKTAADALVPRLAVRSVPADASVADLARIVVETGFSRLPVVDEDLDHVRGFALATDILRVPADHRATTGVTALLRDVLGVPETRELTALLQDMRERGSEMAIVVDEYGGTVGIITLEDVLEEIVGEIEDEYDMAVATLTRGADGLVVLDGGLHPEQVEERTGLVLPEGDYETLAGYLLSALDRIPSEGDQVELAGWVLEVLEMDRLRVARVGARRIRSDTDAGTDDAGDADTRAGEP